MVEYIKVNVRLTDTQLKMLKTSVKNKTGTTLKMCLKILNGNDLPQKLLLTTRQETNLRNVFDNNISTELSRADISKIIQSEGFLGSLLNKVAGLLMKEAIPLAKKYFSSIRNNSSCFST